MEPESVMTPSPVIPTIESAPPLPAEPPKKPKLKPMQLLFGVATILFSLALGIVFFGGDRTGNTEPLEVPDANDQVAVEQATEGWPKFSNPKEFYELSLPPSWESIKRSPLITDSILYDAEDTATLEITSFKDLRSLDEYLGQLDQVNQSLVKSTRSSQVRVGKYDALERAESWPTMGLQVITTYAKVSDMLYIFTLSPAAGKNSITNESVIRDYRTALASFRITDTSQLGLDLKEYQSEKIEGLSFPAFTLKYPQSWVAREEFIGKDTLVVSIYRNNYEIRITQAPVGGAVCLFKDSPDFQGSSGDLRNKDFTEFETTSGITLRRYFNLNEGDKSTIFFCRKETDSPYFSTPTDVGGIVYYVPARYDADIVAEMDAIIKTITPLTQQSSDTETP